MEERLLPTKKDLRKTEQGVWVIVGRKGDKTKKEDVSSLEKVSPTDTGRKIQITD